MKWSSPWAFLVFLPVLAAFLYYWFKLNHEKGSFKFSSSFILKKVPATLRAKLSMLPLVIKVAATCLAIVALARPQEANTKVNRNVEGIDIVLALDISDSMDIEDMEPTNRIESAKMVIRNFIKGRSADKIGLVVFAGESYTRVPLTLDYKILLESLGSVVTDNIKSGTAIGVALANAVARLKESTAKSRVVILLTDGESNSGTIDPATATEIAKGYGIKVYTIGIGRDGQAQLPVYATDAFGRKIKTYQPIHSKVNRELLENIAKETSGKSFVAAETDALKEVFSIIDKLEKTKIEITNYVKYKEVFMPFLIAALMLYLVQLLLSMTWLRRGP